MGWFVLALAARAPFVARIEGILDHDQSIVGLMALDIAAGRRFPIFFDGQRYMGAVEPYVAGLLVALFGHSPVVVALAPWLFFGLFVAGQYVLWRCWGDRLTGHLAALVSVLCCADAGALGDRAARGIHRAACLGDSGPGGLSRLDPHRAPRSRAAGGRRRGASSLPSGISSTPSR